MPESPAAERSRLAIRLVRPLAVLGLPASATAVLYKQVLAHPLLALVAWAVYEALLAAVAFAGKVARRMEQEWIDTAAQNLNDALRRRFSRFHHAYIRYLDKRVRVADTRGWLLEVTHHSSSNRSL